MRFWLTVLAVSALLGLAVRLGRGPERFAAGALAANFFLTIVNRLVRGPGDYYEVDPFVFGLDVFTWLGVTWIALRANRMWPLLVASLQLLVVFAHVSIVTYYGWNQAYWGMMIVSQYAALVVTLAGTVSHHFREKRVGRYRCWRPDLPRAPA